MPRRAADTLAVVAHMHSHERSSKLGPVRHHPTLAANAVDDRFHLMMNIFEPCEQYVISIDPPCLTLTCPGLCKSQVLSIWRKIVPEPPDRIPVTIYTIQNVLFPLVPILFMGYLVRRPNTHVYRVALMPFTIWTILRASFGYVWVDEEFSPYNFGQGKLPNTIFILANELARC